MTGRAAGYCAGYDVPGYANPVRGARRGLGRLFGFGWRTGFGRGRGFGRRPLYGPYGYGAPYGVEPESAPGQTQEQELELLKEQAKSFEGALEDINKRIQELDTETE